MSRQAGSLGGESPTALGHVAALDGIRGIAILLVLATHYFGLPGAGAIGVGLFFVLSGFLITTLLLEERDRHGRVSLRGFYGRRLRRLFPALAALLLAYLIVEAARGQNAIAVVAIAGFYGANIVQAFNVHDPLGGTALAHMWSLAEEEQFYLVWPCLLLILCRTRRLLLWLSLALAGLVAYRAVLAVGGADVVRLYYGPDTHADGLLAGAILAVSRRRSAGFRVPEGVPLAGFAILFFGVLINPWTSAWEEWQWPVFGLGCLALVAAAVSTTQAAELFSLRPLAGLGKVSYSLYLWHIPIFALLGYRHPLLAIPLAFAAALLSYRWVEQPLRRRRRPLGEQLAINPATAG